MNGKQWDHDAVHHPKLDWTNDRHITAIGSRDIWRLTKEGGTTGKWLAIGCIKQQTYF